jgi:hypothetical protein
LARVFSRGLDQEPLAPARIRGERRNCAELVGFVAVGPVRGRLSALQREGPLPDGEDAQVASGGREAE